MHRHPESILQIAGEPSDVEGRSFVDRIDPQFDSARAVGGSGSIGTVQPDFGNFASRAAVRTASRSSQYDRSNRVLFGGNLRSNGSPC